MIRRVGASGLTLLLASSALALGVLTIGGPYASDVEWLADQAAFTPVLMERPAETLPPVATRRSVALAGMVLARPAGIRFDPPTAAAASLEAARVAPVSVEAPEVALLDISPTDAGALTLAAAVPVRAPTLSADVEDSGIRVAKLISRQADLPGIPLTDARALASVSSVEIQPPDTHPLKYALEQGFIAFELRPVEVGLTPVEAPGPAGLLCLGSCGAGRELATCHKAGGAT